MVSDNRQRRCEACGARLARDNGAALCRPCEATRGTNHAVPKQHPAGFWDEPNLRAALTRRHMGQVIRAYRQHPDHGHHGIAQEQVAGWAGISQGQLSRIESGPAIDHLDRLTFWAQLLCIPEDYLWFRLPGDQRPARPAPPQLPPSPDPFESTSHDELAAERAAAIGVDLWELHDVLEARRVTKASLALAEGSTARLDASYAELPPTVMLPELGLQLSHVVGWLREPQPVAYRQRLCSLAGRLAGLRAWLFFDLADHSAADAWYTAAVSAAREADDHDLCAWLLGAQSLIPSYRHDHRAALSLIGAAQEVTRNASPTVRAWVDALEARAHAGFGDSQGFRASEQRATKRLQRTTTDERRHGMDFHEGTLDLTYYQGTGHLFLTEPQPAEEYLQVSFGRLPDNRIKARAILLLGMAMTAVERLQLDEAAVRAAEALTLAEDQPIMPIWQRAEDVRQALGTAASAAVTALDEQMSHFAAALSRTAPKALP